MEQNQLKVIELWQSGKQKQTIRKLTGFTITEIKKIIKEYKDSEYGKQQIEQESSPIYEEQPDFNIEQEGDDENMGLFNKKPEIPPVPSPPPQYKKDTTTDRLDIATGQNTKQQPVEEPAKIPLFARYDESTYMQLQLLEAILAEIKNNTTELVRLRETIERVSK